MNKNNGMHNNVTNNKEECTMNHYNAKYITLTMNNEEKQQWTMITINNDNTQYKWITMYNEQQ